MKGLIQLDNTSWKRHKRALIALLKLNAAAACGSRGQVPLTNISFGVVECQTKPRFASRLSVAINQAGILAFSPRIGEKHISMKTRLFRPFFQAKLTIG